MLSEHFSQFISVHRNAIDIKKIDIYGMDFSHFSESSFQVDVSIQNWNTTSNDSNYLMNTFYGGLMAV